MIDGKALREALGHFATGITIVTTNNSSGAPTGMTVNSFNSLSLDPPLILWSVGRKSGMYDVFSKAGHFAVHILNENQGDLCYLFASKENDRFSQVKTESGIEDLPLLTEYTARFQCKVVNRHDGGDHMLLIGEVLDIETCEGEPLLFYKGELAAIDNKK